jgi:hypothetical protein
MSEESELQTIREQEYRQRRQVNALRRQVFQQTDPSASKQLLEELTKAEGELAALERQRAVLESSTPGGGVVASLDKRTRPSGVLGAETTGLEATVHLRMAQVPTAIYHLFDPAETPLVSCTVRNVGRQGKTRRLRFSSFIDGYSATAVNTVEIKPEDEFTFNQLPSLRPGSAAAVNELTRAMLNVLVEDLDAGTGAVELHATYPIWLLSRTTAPLAVRDPKTGGWNDLTHYFGAFVTPNAPQVMEFLRLAADRHPDKMLAGYQGDPSGIMPQVKALYDALKADAGITYVNSLIAFSPEEGAANQRVRLPRESLSHREANCIDGTVLFASLLEGISMNPAIVLVPGHAFVAWEGWQDSGEWHYLETTMIGSHSFEEACASAQQTASYYEQLANQQDNALAFRRWPLNTLRTTYAITPME